MMPTKMTPSTSKFLVAGVVGFAIFAFSTRQSLIGRSEEVSHRWANVESTLQRRLDLIPQLTEAVQSATAYESETLLKITEERNELLRLVEAMKSAIDSGEKSKAEQLDGELVASVRAFTGLAREAYPELKANEAYLTLMTQLEGTENRINVARQDFNAAVAENNTSVRRWSWMPFCGGFACAEPFRYRGPAEAPPLDLGR